MLTNSVKSTINTFLATSTLVQVQAEIAKRQQRKVSLFEQLDKLNQSEVLDDSSNEGYQEAVKKGDDLACQILAIGNWLEYVESCYDSETWAGLVE